MAQNQSMEARLRFAFLAMGGLSLLLAVFAMVTARSLGSRINELAQTRLPSVDGLWKINEGQTQVQAAQRLVVDPRQSALDRQTELRRIDAAWKQIEDGRHQYEATYADADEKALYARFRERWQVWQDSHRELMRLLNQQISSRGGNLDPAGAQQLAAQLQQ
jgi:methyl-accepting chemotaxis protein WspA